MSTALYGTRVVRGPDWHYQEQDDGAGHVGTVVKGADVRAMHVAVHWDSGLTMSYRAGFDGAHDLRIFDSAPCGVRHVGVSCSECNAADIAGMRWKCSVCPDYDLCSRCYMSDRHDTSHAFERCSGAGAGDKVAVPPRLGAVRLEAAGLFPGAIVLRSSGGTSWTWEQQDDGGKDRSGQVLGVTNWGADACRDAVLVQWQSGPVRVYPAGYRGRVSIQYRICGKGGHYYPDHLPVLKSGPGDRDEHLDDRVFKIGDRVWCDINEAELRKRQQGHGGLDTGMCEVRHKIGLVQRITASEDVVVEYYGPHKQFTFNKLALIKATSFKVDDWLLVDGNEEAVKACQEGRTGWSEAARKMLGKIVNVVKIHTSGDLRVKFKDCECTLNPVCCTLVDKASQQPMPSVNKIAYATSAVQP